MNMIAVTTMCPLCQSQNDDVMVEAKDLELYDGGVLLQEAFPYLSQGERELIKTGVCTPCWDRSMGEEQ